MIPVLPYFNPWMLTNPTLPKLYWEVKSPEQLIANVYCIIDAFSNQVNDITGQVNANTEKIAELEKNFAFEAFGHVDDDHEAMRFVCSWATKPEAVDAMIENL